MQCFRKVCKLHRVMPNVVKVCKLQQYMTFSFVTWGLRTKLERSLDCYNYQAGFGLWDPIIENPWKKSTTLLVYINLLSCTLKTLVKILLVKKLVKMLDIVCPISGKFLLVGASWAIATQHLKVNQLGKSDHFNQPCRGEWGNPLSIRSYKYSTKRYYSVTFISLQRRSIIQTSSQLLLTRHTQPWT